MAQRPVKINVPKLGLRTKLQDELAKLIGQATARKVATQTLLDMVNEYNLVPVSLGTDNEYGGNLRASGRATEKLVIWGDKDVPYAHYVYEGIIYRPNFPIFDWMGNIVGWRSPRGKKKYPSGEYMSYTEWQPERHWDKALIRDHRREYNIRVTNEMKRIAKDKE